MHKDNQWKRVITFGLKNLHDYWPAVIFQANPDSFWGWYFGSKAEIDPTKENAQ
jgi:hypothetical protein